VPRAARCAVILLVTGHLSLATVFSGQPVTKISRLMPPERAPTPCIGENGPRASLSKGRLFASPRHLTPNT
jgi:hypothetical protein